MPDNPILGGNALRRPAEQSPNFVTGVSGWSINADGTVEFNSGTFRGTITAGTFTGNDFIINPSGAFFYSGPPALGNLSISVVPGTVPVTDPKGNTAPAGITLYTGGVPSLNLNPSDGDLNLLNGVAGLTAGALLGFALGLSEAAVQLNGPFSNTAGLNDMAALQLLSSNGAASGAAANMFYLDPAGVTHTYFAQSCAGAVIAAGSVTGRLPATGTSPANPAVAEVWHPVSLAGGPPGIAGTARVKHLAEADLVMIDIQVSFTVLAANSATTIGSLPAGYYPLTARNVPGAPGGTVTNANPPRLFVPAAGGLQLILPAGASSFGVQACIPLD